MPRKLPELRAEDRRLEKVYADLLLENGTVEDETH